MRLHLTIFTILIFLTGLTPAAETKVRFSTLESMDEAGKNLRLALNAWYQESDQPLPSGWTKLTLLKGESLQLDRDHHLLLVDSNSAEANILAISADGPKTAFFAPGTDRILGSFNIVLVSCNSNTATILYRSANQHQEYLSSDEHVMSKLVEIGGYEDSKEIRATGPDQRAVEFANVFLNEVARGRSAEEASKEAFIVVTPKEVRKPDAPPPPAYIDFNDTISQDYADEEPWSAMVTFRIVRGTSSSLQQLRGSVSYKNSGNTSDLPVSASGGPGGGRVTVGSANDRFRATLNALERSKSVSVNSESFIRVPLGGDARFSFSGVNGVMNGTAYTRRVGRDGVELWFDQQGGDWRQFGTTNSKLRFKNGQTIEVSRSTSSRTTSSSSGPPIIKDIPYIGAGVGSSSSSSSDESYALYVTVDLE